VSARQIALAGRAARRTMFALLAAAWTFSAQASPLFEGTTADLWVLDPETGRVVGYNYATWLESYLAGGQPRINLAGNEVALVNALDGSSQMPTPGQPVVSLVDIGAAAGAGDADAGRPLLQINPAAGNYDGTLAVELAVDAKSISDETLVLTWTVNDGARSTRQLNSSVLTPANQRDGYFIERFYLVLGASYVAGATVEFTVAADVFNTSGVVLDGEQSTFGLFSTHPDGFRLDSDGDGIPDLVEAQMNMDPFSDDWQVDSDGDGWSDFDEWLRTLCLDEQLVPIETGAPCLGDDGLPLDSDGDGWADFDEQVRGTNPTDPEPGIAPDVGETEASESFRQRVLRYKDFPAATRLYEVENIVSGSLPPVADAPLPATWTDVQAATILGEDAYALATLVTQEELDAAGLSAAEVAARRLRPAADADLANGILPAMRLPAGSSAVVAATRPLATNSQSPASQVYKHWLSRLPDPSPRSFYEAEGPGTWTTAAEWRQDFIRYLAGTLVVPAVLQVDASSTQAVAVVEGALGEEGRLTGFESVQLFANARDRIAGDMVLATEGGIERFGESDADLDAAITQIDAALAGPLAGLATWIGERIDAPPPGTRSDAWIARQFQLSFDPSCYLTPDEQADLQLDPAAWAAFLERCTAPLSEAELDALFVADRERLYLARLFLLPGVAGRAAADATLLDGDADSDADGARNATEVGLPASSLTLPWDPDTDDDLVGDAVDPCPADPLNKCSINPVVPIVSIDPGFAVAEPVDGEAWALVGLQLDRAYDQPVTVSWEAFIGDGDTATAGADFQAVSGTVTFAPGQRVMVVRVRILGDATEEADEQFSVRITSVTNGKIGGTGVVQVVINNTTPPTGGIDVLFEVNPVVANERQGVELSVVPTLANLGGEARITWRQVDSSGFDVTQDPNWVPDAAVVGFTAPEVLQVTELLFEATVDDLQGSSGTGVARVVVNPVNDAPVVLGRPTYEIKSTEGLILTAAELLAFVEDPDGDPLRVERIFSTVPYGSATLANNLFQLSFGDDPANQVISETMVGTWERAAEEIPSPRLLYSEEDKIGGVLTVDQANDATGPAATFGGRVLQSFIAGTNNLAGVDLFMATPVGSADVTLRIWNSARREGRPLVETRLAGATSESEINLRFPVVTVTPGATYYLELESGTDAFYGFDPGGYEPGELLETEGAPAAGGADLWFRTLGTTVWPRQFTQTLLSGTQTSLSLSRTPVSDLRTTPLGSTAYFKWSGSPGRLYALNPFWRFTNWDGSLARSEINYFSNGLWICDGGEWQRVPGAQQTPAVLPTGLACEDTDAFHPARAGGHMCFAQETEILCADATDTLSYKLPALAAGARILDLAEVGNRRTEGALMFVLEPDGVTVSTHLLRQGDGDPQVTVTPLGSLQTGLARAPVVAALPTGIGDAIVLYPSADRVSAFLYSASSGAPVLTPVPALDRDTQDGHVGSLTLLDSAVYWYRQDFAAAGQRVLLRAAAPWDTPPEEVARLDIPYLSLAPHVAVTDANSGSFYVAAPGIDDALCDLLRIDETGTSSVVANNIGCNRIEALGVRVSNPVIAYEAVNTAAIPDVRNLAAYFPSGLNTTLRIAFRVLDSQGADATLWIDVLVTP